MFSIQNEITDIILNYINESLEKPIMTDFKILNENLQAKYGFSLSEVDITNLINTINSAKNARNDYQLGVKNQFGAVTDWSNALNKSKEIVTKREGEARNLAFTYSKKICMGAYKGPLTIDAMRELKENGYDGTYGPTTMMQMYALYNQNQKLTQEAKEKDAIIVERSQQVAAYESQYRDLHIKLQNKEIEIRGLQNENSTLKTHLNEQNNVIASLSEKVENLSKKLSTQIMDMIRNVFRQSTQQPTIQQYNDEDTKTMQ